MRVLTLDSGFAADKADVRRLQFAPDGRRFAAVLGPAGVPHSVAVCDTASGVVTWEVPSGGDATGEPAVSPDLDTVAWVEDDVTQPDNRIRWWRAGNDTTRDLGASWRTAAVSAVAFHPSGRWLAAGVYDDMLTTRAVSLWHLDGLDRSDPAAIEPLGFNPNESVSALAWSADADRIAVAGESGELRLISGLGAKPLPLGPPHDDVLLLNGAGDSLPARRLSNPIRTLRFAPDGRRLLALDGRALDIWDFDRGEWLFPLRPKPRVTDAAYSPDGRTLAVVRRDGTVTFFDADTLAPRRTYDWKLGPLHSIAFAPDGLTCAAGTTRRRVIFWDLE